MEIGQSFLHVKVFNESDFFPYNGVQPFLFAVHEDDLQSVMCVACKDCYESVKKVFNNFNYSLRKKRRNLGRGQLNFKVVFCYFPH